MNDTSAAAAESMRDQAETGRQLVWAAFQERGPSTADEIAAHLGWERNPYRSRRRCSELKKQGSVTDTGERRRNRSGAKAAVLAAWRLF